MPDLVSHSVSEPWDEHPDVPPMWGEDECLPLDQLHPLVHGASRSLLDGGDEDGAILAAWNAIRDLLRARLDSHEDGMRLIEEIGPARSARLNLTPNKTISQQSQHEGVRHFLRGLHSYARNPIAHDSTLPFQGGREDAIHVLTIMSLVADHVEAAGTHANVQEAVALLSEPDVPLADQAIAAAIARAGRSQFGPLVEEIVSKLAEEQSHIRVASALLAGYTLVLRRSYDVEVFEVAARESSRLLMKAPTTATGLRLLQPGVIRRLDPFAYAKVVSILEGSDPANDQLLAISRAGEIAAALRDPDRARVAGRHLTALNEGDAARIAASIELLVAALNEDQARSPTPLQRRFIEIVVQRFVDRGEAEMDTALRSAFPFPSLSFSLYFIEGLRNAAVEEGAAALSAEFAREFGSLNRWPQSRRRSLVTP